MCFFVIDGGYRMKVFLFSSVLNLKFDFYIRVYKFVGMERRVDCGGCGSNRECVSGVF